MTKNIYVTEPSLPPLDKFVQHLEKIWENRWLTNNGPYHQQFERSLEDYFGVEHASLFVNGTLALIVALKALNIGGEVITTPYSFVATTHALHWNGIKPVFCDINEDDFNINPDKIEELITSETQAIMPVHIYGNPCDNKKIQEIADSHGLKVIYDAAHAFGVEQDGKSILNWGDLSILSFHATKVFNTIEGGAIIAKDQKTKEHIDNLKNFGFVDEVTVVGDGINAKMNELIAAYGVLQLETVDEDIAKCEDKVNLYRKLLSGIDGIKYFSDIDGVKSNNSYFPVLVNEKGFGISRDELYEALKQHDILARRYFYPLISQFSAYKDMPSAKCENLPVASRISEEILCLPLYTDLRDEDIEKIVNLIKMKKS